MPRFFVEKEQICGDEIILTGGDVNHIKNVLRMRVSDELTVCDGCGTDYDCEIAEADREELKLNIKSLNPSDTELDTRIYLFQALPKSDKLELIIQKAVELGVYEIVTVQTSRCIVKLDAKKESKKIARWQQIAESAAKQSGRGIIPRVKAPMSFMEALAYASEFDMAVIPYEKAERIEATRSIIKASKEKGSIGIFIGPEGGFEEKEIEAAKESGVQPITLGRRILRTETAGLAVISMFMLELEK